MKKKHMCQKCFAIFYDMGAGKCPACLFKIPKETQKKPIDDVFHYDPSQREHYIYDSYDHHAWDGDDDLDLLISMKNVNPVDFLKK